MDDAKAIRILSPVLQKGFWHKAVTGVTIRKLLEDQLRFTPDFVEKEIATVFLNGKAVDNIDTAIVADRCELALSGPMPGFVGAAMRRGGYYSSMRETISYSGENKSHQIHDGFIKIKLYNKLVERLGLYFVRRGLLLEKSEVIDLSQTEIAPFMNISSAPEFNDFVLVALDLNT
ncbi:MAG: hypothetical protein WC647_05095 [Desulfomonilaceae bacterium]|jgi:hypothetical protein